MSKESQSHHLSQAGDSKDVAPIPQSHRRAMGEKVTGQDNPYGADVASTESKVANGKPGNW